MTVRELIEALQKLPGELQVFVISIDKRGREEGIGIKYVRHQISDPKLDWPDNVRLYPYWINAECEMEDA